MVPVAALSLGLATPATAASESVLADFEGSTTAPSSFYAYGGNGGGAGYGVETVAAGDPLALPGQTAANNILSVGANVPSGAYAGFGENFTALTDLSAFDGIQFWMYGTGSGAVLQSELLDGARTGSDGGTAERFDTTFADTWTGWKLVQIPFSAYAPATDFNPNPDDGVLDPDSLWGYIFPVVSTPAPVTLKFDRIAAYASGTVASTVSTDAAGDTTEAATASVAVRLNVASSSSVTVDWATSDGTATAGTDYTAGSGTVTFAPGETAKTVPVATLPDTSAEGNETFSVTFSNASGATLGLAQQTVTIRDDDAVAASPVWDNVVLVEPFDYTGAVPTGDADGNTVGFERFTDPNATSVVTPVAPPAPVPGKAADDTALRIDLQAPSYAGVTSKLTNATVDAWVPQDWSRLDGISFWLYGQNTGETLFVDILDNRNPGSTTDDAGRYSTAFVDDTLGWRYVSLPFSTFTRKDIGNGAPNDGLTLSQMHGWALGAVAAPGPHTWYIDDVALTVPETVVDDYEYTTLPSGTDGDGLGLGFQTYAGNGGSASIAPVDDSRTAARPGEGAGNGALGVTMNVPSGWAGVSYAFETAGEWTSQDWSGSQGVNFWLYGYGTGDTLYVDLIDNRSPGSTRDDAGRYSAAFADDVVGWRFVELEWADFVEKNIGNNAPQDGLTLTEIHGYAFGAASTDGEREYLLDRLAVWGDSLQDEPMVVGFDRATYTATEGSTVTATATLSRVSDEAVTVDYATLDSGARTQTEDGAAVEGRDYTPTSGTLTFEPGQTSRTFTVVLPEDSKHELDKTVQLGLSDVTGGTAELSGFARGASVSIADNDPFDPLLIEDFETLPGLWRTDGATLTDIRVTSGSAAAYPRQASDEGVGEVAVTGDDAVVRRDFAQPQDWAGEEALSFWYRGTGSGEPVTLALRDDAAPDPGPAGWTNVTYRDGFDTAAGTAVDPTSWTNETGGWGWGNAESQYYTPGTSNVSTDGAGNLEIELRENTDDSLWCPGNGAPCDYTSARIATQGKQEFMYGHIEARLKVPAGEGLWPAFWTLGNDFLDVGWPQTGEIDVMEHVEGDNGEPNEAFGTIHGPGYAGGQSISGNVFIDEPFSEAFHTFGVDWEPERITWFLDGEVFHEVTPESLPDGSEWVFDHPFFLIANMAIGGNFGGTIDPDLQLPASYLIDYVEVRQAPDTAERFEASFIDDTAGWQQVVVPFSAFQRSTDQPAGAPDNGLTLSSVNGLAFELGGSAAAGDEVLVDQIRLADAVPVDPTTPPTTPPVTPGGPTIPTTPGTPVVNATPAARNALPFTGVELWTALVAALLVAGGTGLTMAARQRRSIGGESAE